MLKFISTTPPNFVPYVKGEYEETIFEETQQKQVACVNAFGHDLVVDIFGAQNDTVFISPLSINLGVLICNELYI
jgi:hypothetical protein